MVEFLLDHGADGRIVSRFGSLVDTAAMMGDRDSLNMLARRGFAMDLPAYISLDDVVKVKASIQKDPVLLKTAFDLQENTPLHLAAMLGKVEIAR